MTIEQVAEHLSDLDGEVMIWEQPDDDWGICCRRGDGYVAIRVPFEHVEPGYLDYAKTKINQSFNRLAKE